MDLLFDTAPAAPSGAGAGKAAPQSEVISQAEFARRLDPPVSRQAVNEAIAKGRLPAAVLAGKKLRWPASWHAWQELRDPQQDHAVTLDPVRRAPEETARAGTPSLATSVPPGETDSLRVARTRQAELDAELARLKLDRERDLLRPRAEVEREMAAVGGVIVTEIRGLEGRAEELAQVDDAKEMRRRLKQIGDELRNTIATALGRWAREGDPEETEHALDA